MPSLSFPHFKQNNRNGRFFTVENKHGYIVTRNDNKKILKLFEEGEKETLYIENELLEDEYSLIGHELAPTCLSEARKADFFYIFFRPKTKTAAVFIYEVKKSIGNSDDIIFHMISQCSASMKYALFIVDSLEEYIDVSKYSGVFVEKLDEQALKTLIKTKEKQIKIVGTNLLGKKIKAQSCLTQSKINILKQLLEKKAFINGEKLNFDFRRMSERTHSYSLKMSDASMKIRNPAFSG